MSHCAQLSISFLQVCPGCLAWGSIDPSQLPAVVQSGTLFSTLGGEMTKQDSISRKHISDLCFRAVGFFPLLQGLLSPRLGTTTHDTCSEDTYSTLLQRYQRSEEELRRVAEEWLECQKRIDAYVDEQVSATRDHHTPRTSSDGPVEGSTKSLALS